MKTTGPIPHPLTTLNNASTVGTSNTTSINVGDSPQNKDEEVGKSTGHNNRQKQTPPTPSSLTRRRLSWAVNDKSLSTKAASQGKLPAEDSKDASDLRNDLMRLMLGDEHLLKVKVQYMDERTALNLQRPINFQEVEQYFQNKYGRLLNFYYTTSTRELMIQIRNQQDLDHVIQLHERTGSRNRMRLILSQKREQHSEQSSTNNHQPPMGIFHSGTITESALSDTSSIWSMLSSSSTTKRTPGGSTIRMGRWAEEKDRDDMPAETPRPPCNWREGRCLGRGAFGHVFICLNVDTGEQLVVKKIFLRGNDRQRSRVLATLENELNLLGTLHHPNIVQYFGIVERNDCVNIFMELMAGGSLKDQITEYGALAEPLSVHFTGQILSGLAYLHRKDIVHRDIKPANILRHTRALVKIGDFGSAKFLQAMCSEQGVDIQGTPHYTAPEIIRDNRRYEPRSDVWSVGITLVEMLTTQTPWAGIEPAAVPIRIAFDSPPQLSLPDGLSAELTGVVHLMLRREPEERPTAEELLTMRPFSKPGSAEEDDKEP